MSTYDCSDLRRCVDDYLLLPQASRLRVLYEYPLFQQFYYFLKGQFPQVMKNDIAELANYQCELTIEEFNTKNNIEIVDFSKPEECFGFENQIVFDTLQSRYFKFGHGYMTKEEVFNKVGKSRSFEDDTKSLAQLNLNDDIEFTDDSNYCPVSPDYSPAPLESEENEKLTLNTIEGDGLEHELLSIEEAALFNEVIVEVDPTQDHSNIIEQEDSRPQFINAPLSFKDQLKSKLDKRRKDIKAMRDDQRRSKINSRRTINNSIALIPKDAILDSVNTEVGESLIRVEALESIKIIKYVYENKETIISGSPELRNFVSGKVTTHRGLYFANETSIAFLSRILNDSRLSSEFERLRSSPYNEEGACGVDSPDKSID